jgi:hypothetical protein
MGIVSEANSIFYCLISILRYILYTLATQAARYPLLARDLRPLAND